MIGPPRKVVSKIQAGLKAFGHDGIEIDGRMGLKTRTAIRESMQALGGDQLIQRRQTCRDLPLLGEVEQKRAHLVETFRRDLVGPLGADGQEHDLAAEQQVSEPDGQRLDQRGDRVARGHFVEPPRNARLEAAEGRVRRRERHGMDEGDPRGGGRPPRRQHAKNNPQVSGSITGARGWSGRHGAYGRNVLEVP